MNSLFKLQLALDGVRGWVPFLSLGFADILKDYTTSTHVLIIHQFHSVSPFLLRVFTEPLDEAFESDIVTIKVASHCHIDVASVELHVDLLVNHSLRVGVKVNPDTRSHFFFKFLVSTLKVKSSLKSSCRHNT